MRAIRAGRHRVVLARTEGRLHAFSAFWPHRRGPLAEGGLRRDRIECPWHHYTYGLDTGENLYPTNVFPQRRELLLDLGG